MLKKRTLLILLSCYCLIASANVNNGIAKLSNLQVQNGIISLDGNWQFFESKTYKEAANENFANYTLLKVPGNWNDIVIGGKGYGTYRALIVLDNKEFEPLSIKFRTIVSASNVYVNGKLSSNTGFFSTNAKKSIAEFIPQNIRIDQFSDTIEICVEVCNYEYRIGGIMFSPLFGEYIDIETSQHREHILYAFLIGALLIITIYFIGFYYTKKDDKISIVFALLCLFTAIRMLVTDEILIKILMPNFNWEVLIKAEFISLFLIAGLGLLFLHFLLPNDSKKAIVKTFLFYNIALSVFVLLFPARITSYIIPYNLFALGLLIIYSLYLVFIGIVKEREGFLLNAFGFAIAFTFGVIDMLSNQKIIFSNFYFLPFGVFVFVIIQAFSITRMFTRTFNKVDLLSKELLLINQNQEILINERTAEINAQAIQLKQSNKVKDSIFSIIAHDLKAPLKSLQTVLDFAHEEDITADELMVYLNGIRRNVGSLNLTLENILSWSRIQMNGLNISAELLDIRSTFQEVLSLYEIIAREKNIQIKYDFSERICAYADKNHLNLILRNLVNNAIKFSNQNSEIKIMVDNSLTKYILVSVCDFGVGIPEDKLKLLFDNESHHTTYGTNNEKGTGLGLQLCKEYIEKNGGVLEVTSTEGIGTTVSFTLPKNV